MTIDFTCQKCEASFEINASDLIDGSSKLVCPHCGVKAPQNLMDDFISALVEMRTQVATLAKKFAVTMAVETEDLEDEKSSDDDDEDDDADEDSDDDLEFDDDDDVDEDEDLEEDSEDEDEP
jgi:hypothetical protein